MWQDNSGTILSHPMSVTRIVYCAHEHIRMPIMNSVNRISWSYLVISVKLSPLSQLLSVDLTNFMNSVGVLYFPVGFRLILLFFPGVLYYKVNWLGEECCNPSLSVVTLQIWKTTIHIRRPIENPAQFCTIENPDFLRKFQNSWTCGEHSCMEESLFKL